MINEDLESLSRTLIEGSTLATIDRRYWGVAVSRPAELSTLYSLGIMDLDTLSSYTVPGADPAEKTRGVPYYQFPTPPSSYEVTEEAATTIVPTQGGGKFVESQGSIVKEIRISGTVGFRPSPKSKSLLPGVQLELPSGVTDMLSDERGLDKKEITALDDITFLRNIFRGYWDLKRTSDEARNYVMYWTYRKESEQYIVEPLSFVTNRDSANPLSWRYNIVLKTLFRSDKLFEYIRDPLDLFEAASGLWGRINQFVTDTVKGIQQLENVFDSSLRLYEVARSIASLPGYIYERVRQSVDRILHKVTLISTGKFEKAFHKGEFEVLAENAKQLRETAYKYMVADENDEGYLAFTKNRTTTPTDTVAERAHRDSIIRGSTMLERAAERALAIDDLFVDSKQVTVDTYADPYNEFGRTPSSSGTPLDPNNIRIPKSGKEVAIEKGDTLRSIAKKYMGDESYWKVLAILNNLRAPYIAQTLSDGVLSYTDKIIVPEGAGDFRNANQVKPTDEDKAESPVALKYYGRDLKITKGSQGTDLMDVEVSQTGDLALIQDIDNVNQAMMIKFSTEQGELATHSNFGAKFPVGSKVSLGLLHEFTINTRKTILQDPRTKSIEDFSVFTQGDIVQVKSKVKLKHSDARLPVNFAVRR